MRPLALLVLALPAAPAASQNPARFDAADVVLGESQRFEALLEADPRFDGRTIAVVGQGRSGFKQPQQVALVNWMLGLGHPIDAVINIDGFNEVAFGMANARDATHPLFPWVGFSISSRARTACKSAPARWG